MAAARCMPGEDCHELHDSMHNYTLSYFTIYFTSMIELVEFYSKVPFYHVCLEVAMVIWIIRLLMLKSYRLKEQEIELTEKEQEELIEEWQPEPLVPQNQHHDKYVLEPRIVKGKASHRITVDGKNCLNLATFNFLGFIGNERVEEAAIETVKKYGVGSCGPRGFYGTIDVHLDLEKKLAEFMKCEEAILYSYGFSTIASVIPAYSKRGDVIFCDEGVGFAIQKGILASRSKVYYFKHNDMEDLERLLKEQEVKDRKNPSKAKVTRRFLVVEGLYVNHGDIAPLPKLVEMKFKYKVRLFMDESASFGVLGATGRGLTQYFNVQIDDVDLISVSMENSLATIGGFCAGSSFVVDHQRLSGSGYCYSASLPPLLAVSATEALKIMEEQPDMFENLNEKSILFHQEMEGVVGLCLGGSEISPVKHLYLEKALQTQEEEEAKLGLVVEKAYEHGIALTVARYLRQDEIGLPRPSIRIALNIQLTEQEIKDSVQVIKDVAKEVLV